jgi:hypothetical protein
MMALQKRGKPLWGFLESKIGDDDFASSKAP